jgi:hypothetical protein
MGARPVGMLLAIPLLRLALCPMGVLLAGSSMLILAYCNMPTLCELSRAQAVRAWHGCAHGVTAVSAP